MIGIFLLLAGAAAGLGLSRWLRLPAIPMLLLAGLALGQVALLPEQEILEQSLVLGLTFLVFVAGIELNPRRVGAQKRAALRVGVAQFLLLGGVGTAFAWAAGLGLQTALYIGLALTASSTLVVVRLLQQRRQLFEPFGRLVIGVLLLQDLLVILLIPLLGRAPDGVIAMATGLAAALLLVALAYVCLRWVTPFIVVRLKPDEEYLLLTVLAILFVFMGMADVLGLPLVAGAFLAGVSLSGFPVSGVIRGLLSSLSDFFLAIFFIAFGALLTLPSPSELYIALLLTVLVVLFTPLLVTVVAERAGLSSRPAIESGLLLAQTSEFSLVVALQGLVLGHVGGEVFRIVAFVTVVTMVLTPFISTDRVTWRLMRLYPARRRGGDELEAQDHILLLGCGDNGMPLLETLITAGKPVVVVDDDPAVIDRLREGDVPCIRGDGTDLDVLRAARAREARVIISTVRRPTENEAVLSYARGVPVICRVFEPEDAETIRADGGTPVLYSEAAAADFLAWLEQAETVGLHRERRRRPREEE
jgi:Kef-type K+ transport system membrane component KefB